MTKKQQLMQILENACAQYTMSISHAFDEVTVEIQAEDVKAVAQVLKSHPDLQFDILIDVCGVDYADYGVYEWKTDNATASGFSRGVDNEIQQQASHQAVERRFAVVYHFLSTHTNLRLRLKCFCKTEMPFVDSIVDVYAAANWFEREAYDLFGIYFNGHPDLRRLLTDYGFIGHPFRKDFPLSGHVEMRYDAKTAKVIYEPVDIEPRVLVPKIGRDDHRYQSPSKE